MTQPLLRAVLWDMDGTIVDTEPLWMAAETELIEAHGGSWTHEDALGCVGLGLHDAARKFQTKGVNLSTDEIVQHLTNEVTAQLESGSFHVRPGALELLQSLRAEGVRCALVTMSLRSMALSVVDRFPEGLFEVVFGGDDVEHPKPHADPYLRAARALGVSPTECVAIEDSPTGVRSAHAAGVAVIGVPLMVPLEGEPTTVQWDTLSHRTPADVAAVLREQTS